jgi:hypothetical protein
MNTGFFKKQLAQRWLRVFVVYASTIGRACKFIASQGCSKYQEEDETPIRAATPAKHSRPEAKLPSIQGSLYALSRKLLPAAGNVKQA